MIETVPVVDDSDECRVICVAQAEWAVIDPNEAEGDEYIASDDATSGSIVVVRAARGGVVIMVHLDTPASMGGLSDMVDRVRARSYAGIFDVMIVGEGHNVGVAIREYDMFYPVLFNPLCPGIAVAVRDAAIYDCRVPPEAKVDRPSAWREP